MAACSNCGSTCVIQTERTFVAQAINNDVHLNLDDSVTPGLLTATLQIADQVACPGNLLVNDGDGWCARAVSDIVDFGIDGMNLYIDYIAADGTTQRKLLDGTTLFTDINVDNITIDAATSELVVTETDGTEHRTPIQRWTGFTITDADLTTAGSPTPADVTAYAQDPANELRSTMIHYIGNGSANDPDYTYYIDLNGNATVIQKPVSLPTTTAVFDITDGTNPFTVNTADVVLFNSPDGSIDVDTSTPDNVQLIANSNAVQITGTATVPTNAQAAAFTAKTGDVLWYGGTAEDPDYAWIKNADGSVTLIKEPGAPGTNPTTVSSPNGSLNVTQNGDDFEVETSCDYSAWVLYRTKSYQLGGGAPDTCDYTNAVVMASETFNTPSEGGNSIGTFSTEFGEATVGAGQGCGRGGSSPPYFGQLFAEGAFRVMPAGCPPSDNVNNAPHNQWVEADPFNDGTGFLLANLGPSGGATDLKLLYQTVSITAGKCYRVSMTAANILRPENMRPEFGGTGFGYPSNLSLEIDGVSVADTGDIISQTPAVYTAEFIAATTGNVEFALVSNVAQSDGNDVGIADISIEEGDVVPGAATCGDALHYKQMACDGTFIASQDRYLDNDDNVLTQAAFDALTDC